MPSIAEQSPRVLAPGRKRRREHDVQPSQNTLQTQPHGVPSPHHSPYSYEKVPLTTYEHVNRKIMPVPSAKRQRFFDGEEEDHGCGSPRSRKQHPHSRSPSNTIAARPPPPSRVHSSAILLAPCHICHRRPTKKSDLDSYAECQGCRERTCFVCLRECQGWLPAIQHGQEAQRDQDDGDGDGDLDLQEQEALSRSFHMEDADEPSDSDPDSLAKATAAIPEVAAKWGIWESGGHRSVVCSQCCIEKGAEGDVVCLGCLSRMKEN